MTQKGVKELYMVCNKEIWKKKMYFLISKVSHRKLPGADGSSMLNPRSYRCLTLLWILRSTKFYVFIGAVNYIGNQKTNFSPISCQPTAYGRDFSTFTWSFT